MGTLKLAYILLFSLLFTLVLSAKSENADEMNEDGNFDEEGNRKEHNVNESESNANSGKGKYERQTSQTQKNKRRNLPDRSVGENFKREKSEINFVEDNEETYNQKKQFLKNLTFEQYKNEENMRIFKRYFTFNVRTSTLFKFIKRIYSHMEMPKNHNNVLKKCFLMYKHTTIPSGITEVFNTYNKEIKIENEGQKESDAVETSDNDMTSKKHGKSNDYPEDDPDDEENYD